MISSASKFLLRLTAAFVAGTAIIVAVGAWRLSSGPVSLGFLSPYLREALNYSGNENFRVELEDTILTWAGFDRGMDIRVIDVRILDVNGEAAARIPEMSIGLNGRSLLRGRFEPTTIDIIGPSLRIIRNEDGTYDFGVGVGVSGEDGVANRLARELLLPPAPSRSTRRLSRVSVIDAGLVFEDRLRGMTWRVPRASAEFSRNQEGLDGDLDLDLVIGGEKITIQSAARFDYVRQSAQIDFQFADVVPAALAAQDDMFAAIKGLDLPVSGNVSFRIATDGSTSPIEFDVAGASGIVGLDPFITEGIDVTAVRARGRIPVSRDAIEFDALRLERTGSSAVASGRIGIVDDDPVLDLGGTLAGLTAADIKRFWPPKLAPIAKDWFAENVFEGVLTSGTFRLSFSAEDLDAPFVPDDAADARFEFAGGRVHYFGELPDISGGAGSVRLTGGSLNLALKEGRIGGIELSEGTLSMVRDDSTAEWAAALEFVGTGSSAEALDIVNQKPFGFPARFGLDPAKVGGLSATRARVRFPMRIDLTETDVEFAAASNLRGTVLEDAFGGYGISDGSLALRVNADGMSIEGTAAINGVPANIAWQEDFTAGPPRISRIRVEGDFDAAARAALGFATGAYVRGTVATEIDVRASGGSFVDAEFKVGLKDARLDFGPLLWKKPAGSEGTVTFKVLPSADNGIAVQQIDLKAPGLEARGELELNSDRSLRRLDASRLAFGRNDLTASVRPLAPEGLIVALSGNSIDAGPYIESFFASEEGGIGDIPPIRLSFQVQRMFLGETRTVHGLSGEVDYSDGGLDSVQMVGSLNEVAPLAFVLQTDPESTQQLTFTSSNAGALAKTTGLFNEAEGGALQISARIESTEDGPAIDGRIEVDDISVTNAPALARLLTLASFSGILEAMNGEGITFAKADIPFVYRDQVLSVSEARAFGPSLGITMEGVIDQRRDSIDLYGTIVPAYSINEVLGSIPLLGSILVGRKGEGVFAINYDIKGPVNEPVVTVNPLTALAPGFLRNFFSIFRGIDQPAPEPIVPPDTL